MNFLIISHVIHTQEDDKFYGYGPYVKEMNLWLKYVDSVTIVAPLSKARPDKIDLAYQHKNIIFKKVPSFNLLTLGSKIRTIIALPYIFMSILIAMVKADHIHLRCPGNMGLLGAIAQLFFPWKNKTVKYAGNWDPDSPQPLSYRVQKKIVSNPFISKNIKVLVYGKWPNQSKNIVEFFTATYHDREKEDIAIRSLNTEVKMLFVGALSVGKRPIIAVQAAHELYRQGEKVALDIMGEGPERPKLEAYIKEHDLSNVVRLHGNQNSEFVKEKFKQSHFLILMSKSEGWPKVVAEAMFWGAVPITTNVSCVNYMIGEGSRGSLVEANGMAVADVIKHYINTPSSYEEAGEKSMEWSRKYTLESFETAIKGVLDE